ncbi:MAG: DUF1573 domain-containing protein [Luteolibacter sp.]
MKTIICSILAMAIGVAAGSAGLAFEKTLIEFHPKPDETHVTADFAFHNDGDKPVRIVNYDAACTCMNVGVSGGKLDYAPGEAGVIRAVFKLAGYYGTIDRVVAIWLDGDAPDAPSARLTLRAHIPQLILIEPKTLTWDRNQEPSPQSIAVEMDPNTKIRILDVRSSSENFTVEWKTHEVGRKYEVIVTPKSTASPGITAIRIDTDCEVESQRSQSAFGVIRNPSP